MSITTAKPATTPIPVQLSEAEFEACILPHLSMPKRGPKCKLGYHRVFHIPSHLPEVTGVVPTPDPEAVPAESMGASSGNRFQMEDVAATTAASEEPTTETTPAALSQTAPDGPAATVEPEATIEGF